MLQWGGIVHVACMQGKSICISMYIYDGIIKEALL